MLANQQGSRFFSCCYQSALWQRMFETGFRLFKRRGEERDWSKNGSVGRWRRTWSVGWFSWSVRLF